MRTLRVRGVDVLVFESNAQMRAIGRLLAEAAQRTTRMAVGGHRSTPAELKAALRDSVKKWPRSRMAR